MCVPAHPPFSHYLIRSLLVDWERIALWTAAVLRELMDQKLADGEFWSVNFPHLPPGEVPMPKRIPALPPTVPRSGT